MRAIILYIDTDNLRNIDDSYLAAYYQALQVCDTPGTLNLIQDLKNEIVRRWMDHTTPLIYERGDVRAIKAAEATT